LRFLALGITALSLWAQAPPPPPAESQGVPPRAAPSDYPAQAKAGDVTIAAEFAGHALPTPEGPLDADDYVVVEVAFYGPAGTRAPIAFSDFSLRVNDKKTPVQAVSYERVWQSVKDPEWVPPVKEEKSKGGLTTGGGNDNSSAPPRPPAELRRAWALRVKKAALAPGDLPLPRAGLIYFPYGGKEKGIRSMELIYTGQAGSVSLELHAAN